MSKQKKNSNEEIITGILKEHDAYDLESALSPKQLAEECRKKGLVEKEAIEGTIINLIDNDVIEYEMDENNQASALWLL